MGKSHAATGAVAGLAVAPLLGLDTPGTVLFAAVTAGFALAPDLDHPGATASRLVGPVTGVLSRLLRAFSKLLYRLTKGPRDEDCEAGHRHATHTLLFAVALGALVGVGTGYGGRWVVLGVLAFGVLLAEAALGDWVLLAAGGGVVAMLAAGDGWAVLDGAAGWVGVAVAVGCVVHCLGDALTLSGCPFLFPLPIAGETWFELRPPRWLRFRTNGPFERYLMFPMLVGLCGVLALNVAAPTFFESVPPPFDHLL